MNYYSRNSPRKPNRNPQPGFLLQSLRSPKRTSKSKLKPTFNRYHQNSVSLPQSHNNTSQEILIIDDSMISSSKDNSILIIQDQQEQNQKLKSQKKKYLNTIKQNKIQGHKHKQQQKERQQLTKKKQAEDKNEFNNKIQNNQIFENNRVRNYSFGNKNHSEETNFDKPTLIKSMNASANKLQQQNKQTIIQKQKLSPTSFKQSFIELPKQQQSWQKLVNNFIKKRGGSKQQVQKKQQQLMVGTTQVKQSVEFGKIDDNRNKLKIALQKQDNQIELQLNEERQQSSSNGTGYFRENSEQKLAHAQKLFAYSEIQRRQKQRKQSIRIQDDENTESNQKLQKSNTRSTHTRQLIYHQSRSVANQIEEYEINQESEQCGCGSTQMLGQIIRELPQKLQSTYELIYEELVRKEEEAGQTIKRMKQTQNMLKLLIQLHYKLIDVDDYLVKDFRSPREEKVVANQQIILGLVRQLALLI